MNNKTVSIKSNGLNWLLGELKQMEVLGDNAFSMPLLRSLQDLFFSFSDEDDGIIRSNVYLKVFDIKKLMNFMNIHGGGLDAIKLLSTEILQNPEEFFKKGYDFELSIELINILGKYKGNQYLSGLTIFFNVLRKVNIKNDTRISIFAKEMYTQLDKDIAERGLDEELVHVLPSFLNFFRDEEYVPAILTKHWKPLVDYITEKGFVSNPSTELICLLSDLLLHANRSFSKELFKEVCAYIHLKVGDLLLNVDYLENPNVNITEDSILLLGYIYVMLYSRNETADFFTILSKPIKCLSNHSENLNEMYKEMIMDLSNDKDPLIESMNQHPDRHNKTASWMYPLIENRINELRSEGITQMSLHQIEALSAMKNALLFIIYYQQFRLFVQIKNSMHEIIASEDGFMDIDMQTGQTYRENLLSVSKYFSSSPLAKLQSINLLPDSVINQNMNMPYQQFMFILRMIMVNNYHNFENLSDFFNKLKEMDQSYINIYNEYTHHILIESDFNKTKLSYLFELLSHSITNTENKKQIIEIISNLHSQDNASNLTFLLDSVYVADDFLLTVKESSDNRLKSLLALLVNIKDHKPNSVLKALTKHLDKDAQMKLIGNIWSIIDLKIKGIELELSQRRISKIQEEKISKEVEDTRIANELKKAEADRLLLIFKKQLKQINDILIKDTSEQTQIDSLSKEITNLANTNINETLSLEERIAQLEKIIAEIKEYIPKLQSIKDNEVDIALMALEAAESYVGPTDESMQIAVTEILGLNYQQVNAALNVKAKQCEAIADQISSLVQTANENLVTLRQTIQTIRQLIRDERLRQAQEVRRIQHEAEVQKQKEADKVLDEEIKRLEEIETAEIIRTKEIVLQYIIKKIEEKPDGDFITLLDKALASWRNDFSPNEVENKTIILQEYDGPLKEILKQIQTKKRDNSGDTQIDFIFNNYRIQANLDRDGVLSITKEAIPEQLHDQINNLRTILNSIAATLIQPKTTYKETKIKVENPESQEVTTYSVSKKPIKYRQNVFDRILRYYGGSNNLYRFSLEGEQIIEDQEFLKDTLLSTDYFIKQQKAGFIMLIPILGDKSQLIQAIQKNGAANIVHISITGHHRRRLTRSDENKHPSAIGPEVKNTDLVVSDATIRRYVDDRIKYQLSDAERQQYPTVESYLDAFIANAENPDGTPKGDVIKKEPYLCFDLGHAFDKEHTLKVSFGEGEANSSVGNARAAYTFVRDSIRLVSLSN
ncbi:MAG: hypothetical protein WCH76_03920 [Candidatus Riflemargulisbacteria bacterium]